MKAVYIVCNEQQSNKSKQKLIKINYVKGDRKMKKEEVAMIGFEIVAYSGEARSKFMEAIKKVKAGTAREDVQELIDEGNKSLNLAHASQTKLLAMEADGEDVELGFIFVHGQDHLMTSILLKDVLEFLMDIYK